MHKTLLAASVAMSTLAAGVAHATDWYVDGLHGINGPSGGTQGPTPTCGAKNNVHGTRALPFKDFWCAQQHVRPGDTIHLLPTAVYEGLFITAAGRPDAPITITGDGLAPKLTRVSNGTSQNNQNFAIDVNATHDVNVSNFDVTHRHSPGNVPSSGIQVKSSVRVSVSGNVVHDVGGNGITGLQSDYLKISRNTVHDTAWNTKPGFFNSGIAVLQSANSDNETTHYKITISSNVVYHNYNTPRKPGDPCSPGSLRCTVYDTDSDGNGIIMDRNADPSSSLPPYRGKTLITNNVVFGNGGRGIHVYLTNHVTISNNSTFLNNQDPYEATVTSGEIEADKAGDVNIYDNVAYTDGQTSAIYGHIHNVGRHGAISVVFATPDMGAVNIGHNVFYSSNGDSLYGIVQRSNTNPPNILAGNVFADPLYVNPTKDPAVADFRLRPGSRALRAGDPAYAPPADIRGAKRPAGRIDLGAYQLTRLIHRIPAIL